MNYHIFFILTNELELINKRTKLGHTPLWAASYKGHVDVVKFLVEQAGANITIPSFSNSITKIQISKIMYQNITFASTPFLVSCQQGNLEVLKYLHSKGANLTEVREDGSTCLSMACLNGHLAIVEYILKKEPSLINQRNYDDQTPLWLASYNGSFAIVQNLIERGAHIDTEINDENDTFTGESPLIVSCQGM